MNKEQEDKSIEGCKMISTITKQSFGKTTDVYVLQCPNCKDWVFSRTNHDFRYCSCEALGVDGGNIDNKFEILTYSRVMGNINFSKLKRENIRLPVSYKELYDDWNHNIDKWGLIKGDLNTYLKTLDAPKKRRKKKNATNRD